MKSSPIISIVPALPPVVNGLGDYAWLLAKELKDSFGTETLFLNSSRGNTETIIASYFQSEIIQDRTEQGLFNILSRYNPECIMIHYVGYAYDNSGVPFWLVQALKKIKKRNPRTIVVTFFHELYSNGPAWSKAFWTKVFQKRVVFDLGKITDLAITNTAVTHTILKERIPSKIVEMIPVFSNVGEPVHIPRTAERDNSLILFGSPPVKRKLYANIRDLEYWFKRVNADKIIDIGESVATDTKHLPVIHKGVLSKEKVSDILLKSKFGILKYPVGLLSKSGVFAAYAAHGLCAIVVSEDSNKKPAAGLIDGIHFLTKDTPVETEKASASLSEWYKSHTVKKTAEAIFKLVMNKRNRATIE